MILSDLIYGNFRVDEPIVGELLESKAMRRLAGIGMLATKFPCTEFSDNTSRLEHSIGVFLLLRRFGAPIEEQIAGLVHDASHSAFSHLVDYVVYGDENAAALGEYGDTIRARYAEKSGISRILEKHGFDPAYIMDDRNFTLKELPLPDICADRLDYTMRELMPGRNFAGWATPEELRAFADSLTVADGRFAFKTMAAARRFAHLYSHMDRTLWAAYAPAKLYHVFARTIKSAINKGILKFDDLYEYGDEEIIARLRGAKDGELDELFRILDLTPREFLKHPCAAGDKYMAKLRRADPLFMDDGRTRRYSERDERYAASLASLPKITEIQPPFHGKIH
ncbi:MAG: HD domain-containing protein [Rickettsiales bacterium]|jgi:HD superfamily phosphohydrolase|nr:HD domain-containing protein [Rickettsiales bacterium]